MMFYEIDPGLRLRLQDEAPPDPDQVNLGLEDLARAGGQVPQQQELRGRILGQGFGRHPSS